MVAGHADCLTLTRPPQSTRASDRIAASRPPTILVSLWTRQINQGRKDQSSGPYLLF